MPRKQKSPFKHFTVEQVENAEKDSYIIQIGHELFYEGDYCAFSKDKTDHFYSVIRAGLDDMIKNGTDIEKQDALISLFNLRVIPLRIM